MRDLFPGAYIKNCCVKFVCFQASIADGRQIEGKSLVMPFYTSSCCLWEVSIAVIHSAIRSTPIENCFWIVVRFLISQLWSTFVNIAGMSRKFTFWRSEVLVLFDKISSFCLHEDSTRRNYPPELFMGNGSHTNLTHLCWFWFLVITM